MKKSLKGNINNKVGETKMMNCGETASIVEYNGANDITVQFKNTGELVNCTYTNFKKGSIKSHFTPTVYGVGIIGLEKTRDENKKNFKPYITWCDMLKRCYDERYKEKYPTYNDRTICEDWKYYKNFKKWYDENYYEIADETMCINKDVLAKRNKTYSPDTCVFVPRSINSLFVKNDADRGELPIGVAWHKRDKKYRAQCSIFDININKYKRKHLGYYNTPEEAFKAYKQFKENYIKLVADHYKNQIPKKLYDAMYEYEVEIDD
ncbi:TPA: AP2/ERF family transcription factor [Clostridium perfringens]